MTLFFIHYLNCCSVAVVTSQLQLQFRIQIAHSKQKNESRSLFSELMDFTFEFKNRITQSIWCAIFLHATGGYVHGVNNVASLNIMCLDVYRVSYFSLFVCGLLALFHRSTACLASIHSERRIFASMSALAKGKVCVMNSRLVSKLAHNFDWKNWIGKAITQHLAARNDCISIIRIIIICAANFHGNFDQFSI